MALPELFREMSARNVLTVYRSATNDQLARGFSWYPDAHSIARALDPADVTRAAGILAALSPQLDWAQNVTLAARTYSERFASGTLPDACRKANAIFVGADPYDVLRGPKVRAFYGAILCPFSISDVVIDRHAFDIALGRVTDKKTRSLLSRVGAYEHTADVYRDAARIVGISPVEIQAITWTVWRETTAAFAKANVRAVG